MKKIKNITSKLFITPGSVPTISVLEITIYYTATYTLNKITRLVNCELIYIV